ncbi:MAG TPA: hypothetical protein VNX15_01670, partial [Gemmatimonadales bacterium]|nr:hypothetical protein [Gemmatimonadales bacterium]
GVAICVVLACGGGSPKSITGGGGGGGGNVKAVLEENFSEYSSTTNMLADPRGIYSTGEDAATTQMVLDQTVGYDSSTQSMRFDYPDRTGEGGSGTTGRCTDYTIGRNINFPSNLTEVWIETVVKFQSGFATVAPSAWGCTSAAAYKMVFGRTPTGRFNLVLGIFGSDYTFGWPTNQEPSDDPMPFSPFDGQWHVYRMHFKVSTPAGSSTSNAACELWVDGVAVKSYTSIVETNAYLYGVAVGRNMNQGPGQAQSMWWGRVTIWDQDPQW